MCLLGKCVLSQFYIFWPGGGSEAAELILSFCMQNLVPPCESSYQQFGITCTCWGDLIVFYQHPYISFAHKGTLSLPVIYQVLFGNLGLLFG